MPDKKELLRNLRAEDVSDAFQLSADAGWNQTVDDWQTLLALAPKTCFGIEIGGELVATTTLICYGQRLGWIGMVLTKYCFQRRGLARKLLHHTLTTADKMGIETLKLDATSQGRPLYLQFGFREEHPIERWSRTGAEGTHFSPAGLPKLLAPDEDESYFGADRGLLLNRLAEISPPLLRNQAYLFARPGRVCDYLGPCVVDDSEDARTLISSFIGLNRGHWFWDLFPENHNAVDIAQRLGFTPQRHLLRMARGNNLPQNVNATYAIAGFELG